MLGLSYGAVGDFRECFGADRKTTVYNNAAAGGKQRCQQQADVNKAKKRAVIGRMRITFAKGQYGRVSKRSWSICAAELAAKTSLPARTRMYRVIPVEVV